MAVVSKTASGTGHGNTIQLKIIKIVFQVFPGIKGTDAQRGIAGVPYTIKLGNNPAITGQNTDIDGGIVLLFLTNTSMLLTIFDTEYDISTLSAIEAPATTRGAQQRLSLLGYEPDGVDGNFGQKSDTAVLNFQADSNLNADGRIDNFTQNQLVKDFGE